MNSELSEKDRQENGSSNYVDESEASTSASANYSHVEGETSPDLLKNTPSNIARLEDVIEQCKARQKYLARTKSPSDGEDVRWYFCKLPLAERELSAAVPRTEVVGKSDYFRFSRRDSLALEASFLQREEELLAYWWKEYAECSEGPSGSRSASKDTESDDLYLVEEERVGVPVKGGLYEEPPVSFFGQKRSFSSSARLSISCAIIGARRNQNTGNTLICCCKERTFMSQAIFQIRTS